MLPSVSKAAKKPFSVATFSKIQLDYPKEFCQFFQGCKFGLAYSFLGHWSRICLFWRIALLLLTTFCGTLKTIFKVAITKNQNYAITTFLFSLSFFLLHRRKKCLADEKRARMPRFSAMNSSLPIMAI